MSCCNENEMCANMIAENGDYKPCGFKECRYWVDYEDEFNCCLFSIEKNGVMNLREIGERVGCGAAQVFNIEKKALKKIEKRLKGKI